MPRPSTGARALASIFENLENGNLSDARTLAANRTGLNLMDYARMNLGWSCIRARAAARYLKGEGSFQEYCDAK